MAINNLLRLFKINQTFTNRQTLIKGIKGVVGLLGVLLAYEAFNFGDSGSPTTTTTTTSTSSTSTTSSEIDLPTQWLIGTKSGTSLLAYKALILSLPDGGTGDQITFPNLDFQGYVTEMNQTVASLVNLLPIVSFVWVNDLLDAPDTFAPSEDEAEILEKQNVTPFDERELKFKRDLPIPTSLIVQEGSPDHLKIISQSPIDAHNFPDSPNFLKDYIYDPSTRDMSTLYILDRGFRLDHLVRYLTPL